MIDGNLAALVALPILAAFLSIYLLKVDDNVGHLFMLMGVGLCAIALLPYVFNTPSDITTILLILGLGCIAWGLTLGKKRFRPQKKRSWKLWGSFDWKLFTYSVRSHRSFVSKTQSRLAWLLSIFGQSSFSNFTRIIVLCKTSRIFLAPRSVRVLNANQASFIAVPNK